MIQSNNPKTRRVVLVLIALAVLFLAIVMFAPYIIHADTGNAPSGAPGTCYILANQSTRTWRYGTASSQTRQEVRRTIQRGRPFGYRQVRGNCTPPVRIN